ncbi:Uncharacterized conserved protein, DUF934 family [Fontimonas thermophila]|uniref:Uncharacterized conserved protein, DUF934 family n=1 Tax=Fontimonas thermophila TaxID=1076937 RepID=A0A1I2IFQ1_9GAMM|nr:DUF934 domain-containing protein [Fontimonas thermophila]SFF40483.1 Uncharacterized conserved protein, DUF934 family [Fontimonas thermophila]
MILIRDGAIAHDDYCALADDAPLPTSGNFIVSLERWLSEHEPLRASAAANIGIRLPNTADLADVWPLIADRPLIELQFPAFGDGRAYSQARLLRERYRYPGEIRASGVAVTIDQVREMYRCGINAFVLRQDQDPQRFITEWVRAREILWYQTSPGAAESVMMRRRSR